ncbi:S24 family peptidase [Bacillus smithii]|jgi:SOS-response transcriptional repressor LexA|nr:S24 family peptidase [Bacillus smithii]
MMRDECSTQETYTLEVEGNAMEPTILEGDILEVDPLQEPKSNGKDLAVLKVHDKYHVCRFTRFGRQILMLHDNAPIVVVRREHVEIVGKVVGGTFINKENHSAGNTMAFG